MRGQPKVVAARTLKSKWRESLLLRSGSKTLAINWVFRTHAVTPLRPSGIVEEYRCFLVVPLSNRGAAELLFCGLIATALLKLV